MSEVGVERGRVSTQVGEAPVLPLMLVSAGIYLAWFAVHYWRRRNANGYLLWPSDPIKAVLQGKPIPAQGTASQAAATASFTSALSQLQPDQTSGSGDNTSLSVGGLVNPIGAGLTGERIDMGVDYGGAGQLKAIGDATVTSIYNAGWPGGVFICLHLNGTDKYVYYAEDITPMTTIGAKVKAGQVIGYASGGGSGIEVGWAAPPGTGDTLAAANGQQATHGDPGAHSTAYGVAFDKLVTRLGGPAGKVVQPVTGTAAAGYS